MKPHIKRQHLLWYKNAAINMQQMIDEDPEMTMADVRVLEKAIKIFNKKFKKVKRM